MMRIELLLCVFVLVSAACCARAQQAAGIPEDFPRFAVPGFEGEMGSLRSLYWLHYRGSGPKATLWDEWLAYPSLWPATMNDSAMIWMRQEWKKTLTARRMDPEGHVVTHQHPSIAHQDGWPFPFWNQGGPGVIGWHFSFQNTVGLPWRPGDLNQPDGWEISNGSAGDVGEDGWKLSLGPQAVVTAPGCDINTFQSPFMQLRWKQTGLQGARPYLEWRSEEKPEWSQQRRMYFDAGAEGQLTFTMVPLFRHPEWTGRVNGVRIGFDNPSEAEVVVHSFFTQYDTRHNINEQSFITGCLEYFWWTHDLGFLRDNINRMRQALRYLMTEHNAGKEDIIRTTWIGHGGRTGLEWLPDGSKRLLHGRGIGNNYWDLLPFGNQDTYATLRYYSSLRLMARIEDEIRRHPEWNVPLGVLSFEPEDLLARAERTKKKGNELFWNPETGRFAACVTLDGYKPDYGFTFVNCEAVYYGFANQENAFSIYEWLDGDRVVEDDTARGEDIYHWRFGPRATTKRNTVWYTFVWSGPETIPWGGQVQDGGAVMGFSYHDMMARINLLGPDSAWRRLKELTCWFDEVQAAGGYREYYKDGETTLQGGGTAGGLGMDHEFFESVLVPQVMLRGFMGFEPTGDGFRVNPRLPQEWPSLAIDRIHFRNLVLSVYTDGDVIQIRKEGETDEPVAIGVPPGQWEFALLRTGDAAEQPWFRPAVASETGDAVEVNWQNASGVILRKRS